MLEISRAEKNCNPGNIRRSTDMFNGEVRPSRDREFKQFTDMDYGFRAMWAVLKSYYYRHHRKTIRQIISRWAPAEDKRNHVNAYVNFVAEKSGHGADEPLKFNYEGMGSVVLAMAQFESGYVRNTWEGHCRKGFDLLLRKH